MCNGELGGGGGMQGQHDSGVTITGELTRSFSDWKATGLTV